MIIRLSTWNIRCQNEGDDAQGHGWSARRERVFGTVRELAPDVLAVQEALAPQVGDLRAALLDFDFAGVGRDDGAQAGEFAGVFWKRERFEKRSEKTLWLSPTPSVPSLGWDARIRRIVNQVRLFDRQTGRDWEVWNTHFDHEGERARLESARLVRRELQGVRVPVALCGDFNASPDSPPIRELLASPPLLREARALSQSPPQGELATFCGFGFEPITDPLAQIDHIFVGPEWKVASFRVSEVSRPFPPASDHRPVTVELSLDA